jgi:hypothetical protein
MQNQNLHTQQQISMSPAQIARMIRIGRTNLFGKVGSIVFLFISIGLLLIQLNMFSFAPPSDENSMLF